MSDKTDTEKQFASNRELLLAFEKYLPKDFFELSNEEKLHHLNMAANVLFKVEENWVLVNADMTLLELLQSNK